MLFLYLLFQVAFQSVSLELTPGELLVVHGPVGCGKTALLYYDMIYYNVI